MSQLINEQARIVSNTPVGPRLHLMVLVSPEISKRVKPGQFVHMKVPGAGEHILRRPFSVYDSNPASGIIEILYQEVGTLTQFMPAIQQGVAELIGPVGNTWGALGRIDTGQASNILLVGGGVGAAPLHLLAKELTARNAAFDVVLGAQTKEAHVCLPRYTYLCGQEPFVATDDGTYGHAGFCTGLVEERLQQGCTHTAQPYDYVAVCGPEPLMRIVADMAAKANVYCEISLEKRMACGIGACLSCVVDTVAGKKRSCVDGPIFAAEEVIW